jgi:hypothetical protein
MAMQPGRCLTMIVDEEAFAAIEEEFGFQRDERWLIQLTFSVRRGRASHLIPLCAALNIFNGSGPNNERPASTLPWAFHIASLLFLHVLRSHLSNQTSQLSALVVLD